MKSYPSTQHPAPSTDFSLMAFLHWFDPSLAHTASKTSIIHNTALNKPHSRPPPFFPLWEWEVPHNLTIDNIYMYVFRGSNIFWRDLSRCCIERASRLGCKMNIASVPPNYPVLKVYPSDHVKERKVKSEEKKWRLNVIDHCYSRSLCWSSTLPVCWLQKHSRTTTFLKTLPNGQKRRIGKRL